MFTLKQLISTVNIFISFSVLWYELTKVFAIKKKKTSCQTAYFNIGFIFEQ